MPHLMSNSGGLGWSAAKGTIAALRLADDIPGAGQGFRLLQFTAPVSSGARGPPVGSQGVHLGFITKGIARGPRGAPVRLGSRSPSRRQLGRQTGAAARRWVAAQRCR